MSWALAPATAVFDRTGENGARKRRRAVRLHRLHRSYPLVLSPKRGARNGHDKGDRPLPLALETAQSGKTVALVCSGDAGVYGMASPILELAPNYPSVEIEVIPGLTAALSGGAVLGAPLAHDFCVISLSDRLTLWEMIEKRLACAAMGDFCVAIYNPSSKGRPDYLQRAVRILLQNGKSEETVCGIVRNIGRERQQSEIITLRELENKQVDMFTTVYIGNKATKNIESKMVTPRGYRTV